MKFDGHFEKKRPHGFIQHWDFCRQPDWNSPMANVSKNSGLQKSPGGGGAGFRVLAHRLKQYQLTSRDTLDGSKKIQQICTNIGNKLKTV